MTITDICAAKFVTRTQEYVCGIKYEISGMVEFRIDKFVISEHLSQVWGQFLTARYMYQFSHVWVSI